MNLLDLITLEELQSIQDSLAKATGLSIVIFDVAGHPITEQTPPHVPFCTDVVQSTDAGYRACRRDDDTAQKQAVRRVSRGPVVHRCHAGLWDSVAPIVVDDAVYGYLWCGRVRAREDGEIDKNAHTVKAREYGIDPQKYLRALKKVPAVPKAHIEASANVLYQVANAIAGRAHEALVEKGRADKALSALRERTDELTVLHRTSSVLAKVREPREALAQVLEDAQQAMGADCLCLYQYDAQQDRFHQPVTTGVLDQRAMAGPTTDQSIVRSVRSRRNPRFAEDAQDDQVLAGEFVKRERIASSAAFPLRVRRHCVGVLFINFRTKQEFSRARRQALAGLANQVALALDYYEVVAELRGKAEQLGRLHRLSGSVLRHQSPRSLFKAIVKSVSTAFNFDGVALYTVVVGEEESSIRGECAEGRGLEWFAETDRPLDGEDILVDVWKHGQTEVIKGTDKRFDRQTFEKHQHKNWVRVFMPVKYLGKVVGVLEAGYLLANRESIQKEEIQALRLFVHQAEIAIANSRRLTQNRASLKIAEILAAKHSAQAMLNMILVEIRKVVPYSTCNVCLLNKRTGELRPFVAQGVDAEKMLALRLKPGEGITWSVFEDGKAKIVNDTRSDPRRKHVPGTSKKKDALLVAPIRSSTQTLGTINLNRYGEVSFTEEDRDWMNSVACQVGVALESAELFERYEMLADSGKAMVGTLPLGDVLEEIAECTRATLDVPIVNVMLLALEGELSIVASAGLPKDFHLPQPLRIGVGLSGWVAQTHETYQTDDMVGDKKTAFPKYLEQWGHVSYIGVPLIHRDELLGVLNVHTTHRRTFSDDETRVFKAFADLAAAAVVSSRALDQSTREFELLTDAGAVVSSRFDLDNILDQLLEEACKLVGADEGCVSCTDDTRSRLVPLSSWPRQGKGRRPSSLGEVEAIAHYVWRTKEPYLTGDVSTDHRHTKESAHVRSQLAVPVFAQDQVIGVFSVTCHRGNAFEERHKRLLAALANLASVAIEKSTLLASLRQTAEAIHSDQADFLHLLIAKASKLVRVLCAPSIWLLDAPNARIYHAAGEDGDPFEECQPLPLKGSISGKVISTREPIVVPDISEEPLYYHEDIAEKAGLRSLLSVPILAADRPVGVFNVHTATPREFLQWEIDVLSAFAAQAGAALEVNRNLSRLRLLYKYVQALNSAPDLAEISARVTEHTLAAVGADVTCLWLYDRETGGFYYGGSHGLEEEEIQWALPRPGGMSQEIAEHGKAIIIPDTENEPVGKVNPHAMRVGIRAIAGLPLSAAGSPIGVFYVDFRHPHYYTADEIDTLETMARLAAVAIDNARSVEARRQFLITVSHDLRAPLSAVDAQFQILDRFGFRPDVVRKTYGEIRRLTQLVETLTGVLRAEYATKPLRAEAVDMARMLSTVEDMWSALIEKRGLTVATHVTRGARVVWSDEERVRCIVYNLLNNAIKFASSSARVLVQKTRRRASFTIVVEDDGPGMAPELVQRFQLAADAVPGPYWDEMSSGIGYAAVRRFAADMGGELAIESSPAGTRVSVVLPFLSPNDG